MASIIICSIIICKRSSVGWEKGKQRRIREQGIDVTRSGELLPWL
jgi:hypothetical protein